MAEKKRELWADYAKGICILLVFIGHSDAIPQAVRIFIYLFHMPMFFFCMGYYSSTAGTFGAFAKKRFRQLMVPFFAYGILYHVLCLGIVVPLLRGGADWALCRDNILGLLVQLRGTDLVAPKWFLTAAFVASVLFYALRKYVHDRRIEFPVVLAASAGFAYLNKFTGFSLPWYIDVAFPCVLFMYLGQYVREKNVEITGKKTLILAAVGIAAAAGLTLLFSDSPEKYCIDYRVIRLTPFVPVMAGGFALCLALYGALKNVKKKGILSYIGVNSMLFYLFDNLPELLVKKSDGVHRRDERIYREPLPAHRHPSPHAGHRDVCEVFCVVPVRPQKGELEFRLRKTLQSQKERKYISSNKLPRMRELFAAYSWSKMVLPSSRGPNVSFQVRCGSLAS